MTISLQSHQTATAQPARCRRCHTGEPERSWLGIPLGGVCWLITRARHQPNGPD